MHQGSKCMSQYRKPNTHTHTPIQSVWADILMCGCQPTKLEWNIFHIRLGSKSFFVYMCNEAFTNEVTVWTGKGNPKQWKSIGKWCERREKPINIFFFSYSFHVIRWIIMLIHHESFCTWMYEICGRPYGERW